MNSEFESRVSVRPSKRQELWSQGRCLFIKSTCIKMLEVRENLFLISSKVLSVIFWLGRVNGFWLLVPATSKSCDNISWAKVISLFLFLTDLGPGLTLSGKKNAETYVGFLSSVSKVSAQTIDQRLSSLLLGVNRIMKL